MQLGNRRTGHQLALATLLAVTMLLTPGTAPATASSDDGPDAAALTWTATVDGKDVDRAGEGAAVPLETDRPLEVTVTMTNASSEAVRVEGVRLEGRVMGLAFFRFGAGLDVLVRPTGDPVTRTVELRTNQLPRQAVGLMPTQVQLLGADRAVLSTKSFPVDVRGSLLSAYGVFGLVALGVTLVLVARLAWATFREQLPGNRWVRGVRFAAPGLGVGLTLTFFLSVTRLLTPDPELWLPLVAGLGALGLLLGYFLPGIGTATTTGPDRQSDHHRSAPRAPWRPSPVVRVPGQRRADATSRGRLAKVGSLRRRGS